MENMDDFVKIIRSSKNRDEAKIRLMERFTITERRQMQF